MNPSSIKRSDSAYPARLKERLGEDSPGQLFLHGHAGLLSQPMTALFCSVRCPGSAILRTYDQAARWRDSGRCIISGFHSPVEKECLRILLRGTSPVIISPARGLPKRLPAEWQEPLDKGRMLILSIFPAKLARVTADLAARRNEFVASLADEAWFAHIAPGGQMADLAKCVHTWGGALSLPGEKA